MFALRPQHRHAVLHPGRHVGHVHVHNKRVRSFRFLLARLYVPLSNQELGRQLAFRGPQLLIDRGQSVGLRLGLDDLSFGLAFCFQDLALLLCFGKVDVRNALALGCKDGGALLALSLRLKNHGV